MNRAFSDMRNRIARPTATNRENSERKFTFSLGRGGSESLAAHSEDAEDDDNFENNIDDVGLDDMSDDSEGYTYFGYATPVHRSNRDRQVTDASEVSIGAAEVSDEVANGVMLQHRNTGEPLQRRQVEQQKPPPVTAASPGRKSRYIKWFF